MPNNTISFPDKAKVEEQAAEWLAAIDRGLSDQEAQQLDDWLAASPLHGEVLVHFAAVWDKMNILSAVAKVLPLDTVGDTPTVVEPAPSAVAVSRFKQVGWAACAAVVAAVSLIVVSEQTQPIDKPLMPEVSSYSIYKTDVGQSKVIALDDGSFVTLNTNSRLRVSYTESARAVELLDGEAYFDVAKDASRPFTAKVGDDTVTAVGTAFNIERLADDSFELIVTEGIVKVEQDTQQGLADTVEASPVEQAAPLLLKQGKQLIVDDAELQLSTPEPAQIEVTLAWQEGMLVFQGESLQQALQEINRYSELQFEIKDPSIRAIEVGGYFRAGDSKELLMMLRHNFGIVHQEKNGKIWLSAAL